MLGNSRFRDGAVMIELKVNGQTHRLEVDPVAFSLRIADHDLRWG